MKKVKILRIKIDNISFFETTKKIADFVNSDKSHQIATVNPEFLIATRKDKEFFKAINSASLAVPDGTGLIWASKFLYGSKNKLKERVTGVDLVWAIAKLASERGWSIYFLGAGPGIAQIAASRLKVLNPHLKVVGISMGEPKYSREKVLESIKKSKADILLVAYGSPKQEKFIYNSLDKLGVKVAMGVGGTFDFIAGVQKRAPKWMQKLSLEWLYRLIREPKRFGRIWTAVVKFPIAVIWSKVFR